MKTVAIISRHNVCNYGSILQAFATEAVLRSLGYEPVTIDYKRTAETPDELVKRYSYGKSLPHRLYRKHIWRHMYDVENRRFRDMQERYLTLSTHVDERTLWNNLPNVDIYLTGSDQVWNALGDGTLDGAFFWVGADAGKPTVAYAASFGKGCIESGYEGQVAQWLQRYSAISVREDTGVDIVRNVGFDAEHVLDPTLLLSANQWGCIANKFERGGVLVILLLCITSIETVGFWIMSNRRLLARDLMSLAYAQRFAEELVATCFFPPLRSFSGCSRTRSASIPTRFTARLSPLISRGLLLPSSQSKTRIETSRYCVYLVLRGNLMTCSRETHGTIRLLTGQNPALFYKANERGVCAGLTVPSVDSMNNISQISSDACYGCMACAAICPKGCIFVERDTGGFSVPVVDEGVCVSCGACLGACPSQNPPLLRSPQATYAAVHRDASILEQSTSGGAFTAVAEDVLSQGGVVYGCALDSSMRVCHVRVTSHTELAKLRGSKYVQSLVGVEVYKRCRKDLNSNTNVLFSGTPCQIAALLCYLKAMCCSLEYLVTADLVCHGVCSPGFFERAVSNYEKRNDVSVKKVCFRGKVNGWRLSGSLDVKSRKDREKRLVYHPLLFPYYRHFLAGDAYRECCYSCRFACGSRVADITLGDYWGVEEAIPSRDFDEGCSLVLVQSERAFSLIAENKALDLTVSDFPKAAVRNRQLVSPSSRPQSRDKYILKYNNESIFEEFYCKNQIGRLVRRIFFRLPKWARRILRKK